MKITHCCHPLSCKRTASFGSFFSVYPSGEGSGLRLALWWRRWESWTKRAGGKSRRKMIQCMIPNSPENGRCLPAFPAIGELWSERCDARGRYMELKCLASRWSGRHRSQVCRGTPRRRSTGEEKILHQRNSILAYPRNEKSRPWNPWKKNFFDTWHVNLPPKGPQRGAL
jgi:hypothetical protein